MAMTWFDTKELKAFAQEIARDYLKLSKSVQVRHDSAAKRVERFARLKARADEFYRTKQLNVFKRARLISELRTQLESVGVPDEEASEFVSSVLFKPLAGS